jgi:hypothetical protein
MVIANMNYHEIDYNLPDEFKYKPELITSNYTNEFVKIPAYGAVIIKA